MTEQPQKWSGLTRFLMGKNFSFTLLRIAILVCSVMVAYKWFLAPFVVSGDSMLPTLLDGQVHLAYRRAYKHQSPQRGDIVLIDIAGGLQFLVKRIVALPGETVSIRKGVFYINGSPLEEPYVKARNTSWNMPDLILRPEEYYFVGDNRSMDMPNHTMGTIRAERLVGKLWY